MHQEDEPGDISALIAPLTTRWIEHHAGVSRDTVSAWRGGRPPREDHWQRLTTALDAWRRGLPMDEEAAPQWAERLKKKTVEELTQVIRQARQDQLLLQALANLSRQIAELQPPADESQGPPRSPDDPSSTAQ
jgi:hypothetical protein